MVWMFRNNARANVDRGNAWADRQRLRQKLRLDLAVELDEFPGEIEQADDVGIRKPFDPQQMALAEDERGLRGNVH